MPCLFCQIVEKTQPADVVHEDDDILVFKDVAPKAPIHVLIIPKLHLDTVNDMEDAHIPLMGKLFATAKQLATQWDIVEQGYRLTINVGRGGGQVIDHMHMHMVSGRHYSEMHMTSCRKFGPSATNILFRTDPKWYEVKCILL